MANLFSKNAQSLPMIWKETSQQSTSCRIPTNSVSLPTGHSSQHSSDYPRPGRKTEPRKPPKVRGQWRVRSTILKQRRRRWHVFWVPYGVKHFQHLEEYGTAMSVSTRKSHILWRSIRTCFKELPLRNWCA